MSKTRMGKRVASLLLSLVMMLSLLPTTVYAEMTNDVATYDAVQQTESVDTVDLQEASVIEAVEPAGGVPEGYTLWTPSESDYVIDEESNQFIVSSYKKNIAKAYIYFFTAKVTVDGVEYQTVLDSGDKNDFHGNGTVPCFYYLENGIIVRNLKDTATTPSQTWVSVSIDYAGRVDLSTNDQTAYFVEDVGFVTSLNDVTADRVIVYECNTRPRNLTLCGLPYGIGAWCDVVIDPNGGSFAGHTEAYTAVSGMNKNQSFSDEPVRDGYGFAGWTISFTPVENVVTFTAQWADAGSGVITTDPVDEEGIIKVGVTGVPHDGDTEIRIDARADGSSALKTVVGVDQQTLHAERCDVTIETNVGTLVINAAAWASRAASAEDGSHADLSIERSDDGKKYIITAMDGSNNIYPAGSDGSVTISVPYEGTNPVVYYVDGTTKTDMNATYENSVLTWVTNHFSEFVIEEASTAYVTVNGGTTQYTTLDEAIAAAEPVNGVITYTINGKVEVTATDAWIQVAKDGLSGLTEVAFVGATDDAEICITNSQSVLADQKYDIDVSFKGLTLSHPNGAWVKDLGHATNYFACVLRNTDAANNTVTYTNCTFPNGVCNNQYGKTVFDGCKFSNATSGKYSLWNYGGNTEVKDSTFTGVRGIKTYNEGTLTVAPTVTVENTTFTGLTEKAAIVASKATDITLTNVSAADCGGGLLQKDIEGGSLKTTIEANGTGISGKFDITATTTEDAAKDEFNISAGTFTAEVSSDYLADGFTITDSKDASGNITYGVTEAASNDGTAAHPYTLAELGKMTRAEYIAAQTRLGGTMYVTVGNYSYETNGTLGNGTADNSDRDSTKLNYYGAPGAKSGQYSDAAVGKNIVFVGGSITSNVTGYESIDNIGTSLLLAVPAYTNVTFQGTEFNNVMSFNYQLYTSPWSQLGELTFDGCTFNGIVVGAIAAQTLTFNGCTFTNYTNTSSANNSNPTWIRPAYGNWTKGDNEGQGSDFRSLTEINFTGNTVTSTRPVKFERIAQWEMPTTVAATGNTFNISAQEGDTETKNVGMYFGANAKFDLVADNNTKSEGTAALYTAVYSAPDSKNYAGLPAGSTVKDSKGDAATLDAYEWKTTTELTLETTEEVASVKNTKGTVNFATLQEAIAAAQDGATVTLLTDVTTTATITVAADKDITLDLNGKTVTYTGMSSAISVEAGAKLTVKDSTDGTGNINSTGNCSVGITSQGTLVIESGSFSAYYGALCVRGGSVTINGGTFSSSTGRYGMYYWSNKTALTVTITNGRFEAAVQAPTKDEFTLSVKGGSFSNDLSAYCPDGFGTTLDADTNMYVYGSVQAPAGYAEDANGNVTISDEDGLFWFAKQVNEKGNTFKGKTVTLLSDITLTKTWTPVGGSKAMFQGTFDGDGRTISGVACSSWSGYGLGFFANIASATIKDVTFANADINGNNAVNIVGIVAAYSYGDSVFENVHVTDSAVSGYGKVGGMVGMAADPGRSITFKNCSVTGTSIEGTYNVAGFCGLALGTCSITGSHLEKNTVTLKADSHNFSGGFVDLDTTVTCDSSVSTCAGNGTHIKGKYAADAKCYYSAYSDLYNRYGADGHDCTLAGTTLTLAHSEVTHDAPVEINGVKYSDLQAAFDAAKTGDTVTLLSDITLTEQVNITKALNGLTLDGNGKTITCATTTDPFQSGGSALYFGNADQHLYCTGIKIKDLTMTGKARFAIFLCGGTTTEFTNVNISGNYYIAVNLYGTHGATMTNCNISNSTTGTDKYISGIWSNVSSANPLTLNSSTVDVIAINTYTTANEREPKIFVMDGSEAEIHTLDDGSVSGNKKLCVSTESTGTYTIKEYDETTSTWVEVKDYVAEVNGTGYATLADAIEAAEAGQTVTLLADTTEDVTINKNITLDLGGKTLTNTGAGKATLTIAKGATATVQNGSVVGGSSYYTIQNNGTATLEGVTATAGNTGSSMLDNWGTLTIESGTYTGGLDTVKSEEGSTLTINGGKFVSEYAPAYNVTGVVLAYGTTTINGGEFVQNSTSSAARVIVTGVVEGYSSITYVKGGSFTSKGGAIFHGLGKATSANFEVSGGTFNKSISEGFCADGFIPTKNADGTYGVKEGKYVAQVGSTKYETLADAIRLAAKGKTVTLLCDVTENVTISKNLTLDLGGFTLTNAGAGKATLTIAAGATATVKNGSVVGGTSHYTIQNNGTATLEGVTATAGNTGSSMLDNAGTLTITSGTYTGGMNTVKNEPNATLTINGGTFENSYGENNAHTGVVYNLGALEITGGAFTQFATTPAWACPHVIMTAYEGVTPSTVIKGGTFTSTLKNWKGTILNHDGADSAGTIKVSGGTFNMKVIEDYCADGYIPTKNEDGTYGVKEGTYVAEVNGTKYEKLQEAINAAKSGATVTLLADVDLTAPAVVSEDQNITLELNGKKIYNSEDIWQGNDWSLISVRGGTLTITGSGALEAKKNDCYALDVQDGGNLTVNGDASYVGNIHAIYVEAGTATVNGGSYSVQQKYPDETKADEFVLNCYDPNRANGTAKIIVSGGTFTNFDPRNNQAEGAGTSFVAEGVGVNNENGTFTAKANMVAQIIAADGSSVKAYDNLANAFYYASDEKNPTLIVLRDIVDSNPVTITATNTTDSITLDLNGHNISFVENEWSANWSGLNIQNATALDLVITGKGTITAAASNIAAICVQGSRLSTRTTLTIDEDVTVVASTGVLIDMYRAGGYASCGDNITVNIAGTVKNTSESEDYAISVNGEIKEQQPVINVMSTATIEANGWGMYLAGNNKTNIASCAQISGTVTGIEIRAGELTLDGCTVTGGNGELAADANGNGATVRNAAIAVSQHTTKLPITVNVKGGSYTATAPVYQKDVQNNGTDNVKVFIENGMFTGKVEATTAGALAISGGKFTNAVLSEYCAPGYVPTDVGSDGLYTVKEGEFTVQVTSRTVSSASPVANVSGGGSGIKYATGTKVTAASLSGYEFKGWFVDEYVQDSSKPVETALSFTYNPTADCTLIAVYEPISGAKFYLTVHASEFTVGESAVYDSYMHDQVAAGESVTVTFKGTENFLYWVNASRKVVSTNLAYTFIMGSETTLSAVYGKARVNQATVVFMSDSDQIITSTAYKNNDSIQFPTPPIKMGCTFTGWSMTEKNIQDAIAASNNGVIVVKACYTDPSTPYTVTVLYPDDTKEEYSGMVGKTVTLTAKEISGKTFSYWTDSENNVLGYTTTLMLAPSGNITVNAVYSDTAVAAKPVITMTAVEAGKAETGYYVISFTATRAVPEGYTVVKQGILYSVDSQCTGEGAKDYMKLTDEGSVPAGIYEYIGNNTELSGVTVLHAKVWAVDRTIYGRGYMVLQNSSGTMEYVYSDNILSGSYSGLTKIGG